MNTELTKEGKKALAILYSAYVVRRSAGQRKSQAIRFDESTADGKRVLQEISESLSELENAGFLKRYITDNVDITDKAIIYMEDLPIKTTKEWMSFFSQFKP